MARPRIRGKGRTGAPPLPGTAPLIGAPPNSPPLFPPQGGKRAPSPGPRAMDRGRASASARRGAFVVSERTVSGLASDALRAGAPARPRPAEVLRRSSSPSRAALTRRLGSSTHSCPCRPDRSAAEWRDLGAGALRCCAAFPHPDSSPALGMTRSGDEGSPLSSRPPAGGHVRAGRNDQYPPAVRVGISPPMRVGGSLSATTGRRRGGRPGAPPRPPATAASTTATRPPLPFPPPAPADPFDSLRSLRAWTELGRFRRKCQP